MFKVLASAGVVAAAVSLGIPSASEALGPDRAEAGRIVGGTVTYAKRNCFGGKVTRTPLSGAKILVRASGGPPAVDTLDDDGHFRVTVQGTGQIEADVLLSGEDLNVRPRGGRLPYEIETGPLAASGAYNANQVNFTSPGAAGAASIWSILSEGARVAAATSPKPIQPVKVLWRYQPDLKTWKDDRLVTQYDNVRDAFLLHVGGTEPGPYRAEYAAWMLLHEYGHHVLDTVALPPGDFTQPHGWTSVHRDEPALPWAEGFGHAFAAIVLGNPKLTEGCNVKMNVKATPATPLPSNRRFAQYNETAVAGIVWKVVSRLGGGEKGLKTFLKALGTYRRGGQPARDLRDVRDLLIDEKVEKNYAQWGADDAIFWKQGVSWDIAISLSSQRDPRGEISYTDMEIKGPYSCKTTRNPPDGDVNGGLPYDTSHDDCDAGISTPGTGVGATMSFPYLAGGRHRSGDFSVTASWDCKDYLGPPPYPCDRSPLKFNIRVWRHQNVSTNGGGNRLIFLGTVTLPIKTSVEILRYDALGGCTIVPTKTDCGV